MDVYFAVTIDTESDRSPDWSISKNTSFHSVTYAIPYKFMPLFEKYLVIPTFLLSPEVVENDKCVKVLQNLKDGAELGTHLHSEFAEPFRTLFPSNMAGKKTKIMQSRYSENIEKKKLEWTTKLFQTKFGYLPKSFRAGRFGLGKNTLEHLAYLGYTVDTSVTPGIRWCDEGGKADFREWTFNSKRITVSEKNNLTIVEIPITILPKSMGERMFESSRLMHFSIMAQSLLNRINEANWLRPSYNTADRMINICKKVIKFSKDKSKPIILNMMLHNVEVISNASPYSKSQFQANLVMERMEKVLEYGRAEGFIFQSLSKTAEAIQ